MNGIDIFAGILGCMLLLTQGWAINIMVGVSKKQGEMNGSLKRNITDVEKNTEDIKHIKGVCPLCPKDR